MIAAQQRELPSAAAGVVGGSKPPRASAVDIHRAFLRDNSLANGILGWGHRRRSYVEAVPQGIRSGQREFECRAFEFKSKKINLT